MNSTQKNVTSQYSISKHLIKSTSKKVLQPKFLSYMEDKGIKLDRISVCGGWLQFQTNKDKSAFFLDRGDFCKNRFCPLCSWLKARKSAIEMLKIIRAINIVTKNEFVFITLTAPNVPADRLSEEITDFNKAFKRLYQMDEFKKACKGYIRKLEVTYNKERNDFHPHFHIVMAVNKSYFTSRYYISEPKLLKMWQKAKKDDTITQIDMRKVKMGSVSEVMEMATYATKQAQLYKNKEIFDVFYNSLKGRQIVTYNGIFAEYKKLLKKGIVEIIDEELKKYEEKTHYAIDYWWQKATNQYIEGLTEELKDWEKKTFYNLDIDVD